MSYVDLQKTVSAIRESVLSSFAGPQAAEQPYSPPVCGGQVGLDLGRLRETAQRVRRAEKLVGQLPPQPSGVRAKVGAVLVRLVQRMLFWYTPQITAFHHMVTELADAQISGLSEVDRALQALKSALESVRSDEAGALRLRTLEARLDMAVESSNRLGAALEAAQPETLEARIDAAAERSSRLEAALDAAHRELAQVKTDLVAQDRRVSVLLQEAGRRLPEPFSGEQVQILAEEDRSHLDTLYAAFEDTFRGSRAMIKDRLRVYIPILREAGLGRPDTPVIDLGCGRGEWLEVLAEDGLCGQGVDVNRAMLARCEASGVRAFHADALAYLRSMPAASVGVVTAFHVLEHLPFRQLIDVLDETVRVLKPGGISIFETPDPANTSVGSHTFYMDPTHRNPLPSAALRFIAEARGLFRVEVIHLNPYPPEHRIPDDDRGFAQRFNQLFYGPQDYAIIGRKL